MTLTINYDNLCITMSRYKRDVIKNCDLLKMEMWKNGFDCDVYNWHDYLKIHYNLDISVFTI